MSEESTNAADVRVGEPVVRIEGLRKSFGDNVVLPGSTLRCNAAKWWSSWVRRVRASRRCCAA